MRMIVIGEEALKVAGEIEQWRWAKAVKAGGKTGQVQCKVEMHWRVGQSRRKLAGSYRVDRKASLGPLAAACGLLPMQTALMMMRKQTPFWVAKREAPRLRAILFRAAAGNCLPTFDPDY